MARRRGQRKGYLHIRGASWLLEWREYHSADGRDVPVRMARVLCPTRDPETGKTITKKQAERLAWELVLSKLEQVTLYAESLMLVGDFIARRFRPEWIWALKPAGQAHYENMLKHIAPPPWRAGLQTTPKTVIEAEGRYWQASRRGKTAQQPPRFVGAGPIADGTVEWVNVPDRYLAHKKLRAVGPLEIQQIVKRLIEEGASTQTARHVRNVCSAIFEHARAVGAYQGDNPAARIRLPEMQRKERHALSAEQARAVLAELPGQCRAMALLSMIGSLNIAEMAALRWKWVNLDDENRIVDGEALPPGTVAVRGNFYRGKFGSTKTTARMRIVPLAEAVIELLSELRNTSEYAGPEDFVFTNSRGGPVDDLNLVKRKLVPAGERAGLPFRLTWHVFRHTTATLADITDMRAGDRKALMGHSSLDTTMIYTHSELNVRRQAVEKMAALIVPKPGKIAVIGGKDVRRKDIVAG
jgi:integrase